MPTVNSVPATFVLAGGSDSQGVTFAIPTGFICSTASLTITGTFNVTPTLTSLQFNWAVSGEMDTFVGSVVTLTYTGSANVSTGGIADINAAAGGNVAGTVVMAAPIGVLSVSSFVLTITGVFYMQNTFSSDNSITTQQIVAIPF